MTSVLIYSLRSDYCKELIEFVKSDDLLKTIVKFHDVNTQGVPNGISRVPTLISPEGKFIIGGDIKEYLEGFIVSDIEPVGGNFKSVELDGSNSTGNWFEIDRFGQSLQPKMTKDLEEKISMSVEDAYHKLKS